MYQDVLVTIVLWIKYKPLGENLVADDPDRVQKPAVGSCRNCFNVDQESIELNGVLRCFVTRGIGQIATDFDERRSIDERSKATANFETSEGWLRRSGPVVRRRSG